MGLREKLRAGNSRCHAGSAHRIPLPAADPRGRKIRCGLGRAKTNRSLRLACDPRKHSSRTLSLPDESTRTKLLQSPETSIVLWVTRTAANEDDKKFILGISRSSNADDKRDPLTLDHLLDKAPLPRKLEKLTPWQVSRRSSSGASRASSM